MVEVSDKFSVIVPVLNSKDYLRPCLDSILAAIERYGNAELIVLDNGSDDGSYEILCNEYSGRARIQQVRGVPVSTLRNRGAALAEGEFLTFIDSDCLIGLDYFSAARQLLGPQTDATGSQPVWRDGDWIERAWYGMRVPRQDGPAKCISSANFVIKRQVFLSAGGFDESMMSCEDDELGLRLNKAGFHLYQSRAVRAVHAGADENLRMFFYKTAWRSLGMFRMMKHGWISKPVLMTFAHAALCLMALASLFVRNQSLLTHVILFLLLVNLAPAVTIVFRSLQMRRVLYAPLRLMVLYHLYFVARIYTIWNIIASWGAPDKGVARSARLHNSAKTSQ